MTQSRFPFKFERSGTWAVLSPARWSAKLASRVTFTQVGCGLAPERAPTSSVVDNEWLMTRLKDLKVVV